MSRLHQLTITTFLTLLGWLLASFGAIESMAQPDAPLWGWVAVLGGVALLILSFRVTARVGTHLLALAIGLAMALGLHAFLAFGPHFVLVRTSQTGECADSLSIGISGDRFAPVPSRAGVSTALYWLERRDRSLTLRQGEADGAELRSIGYVTASMSEYQHITLAGCGVSAKSGRYLL